MRQDYGHMWLCFSDCSFLPSVHVYFAGGGGGQLQKNQLSGVRDIIFWNACLPESPFCWCGWTAAKWCLLCLSKERLSLSYLWMWNQACSSQEEKYLNINSQTASVANSRVCCRDWLCRAGLYHPSTPLATRTSSLSLPANLSHSNLHNSLQDPFHSSGCIPSEKEEGLCLQMP